jgi:RHH-type rel operon transcriptional repressor/antitoxin RelB
MAMAQVNARISSDLKARGDAALQAAGLSPTQAVRALWELAVRYAETPQALTRALFPDQAAQQDAEQAMLEEQRRRAVAEGPSIVERAYRDADLPWPSNEAVLSYDELRDVAYEERYGDSMGWAR